MKTVKGIYPDLLDSTYIYKVNNLTIYFSSLFYMNKFKNELSDYIKYETFKIKQKYHIYCNFDLLLTLALYSKIEKRGFHVLYNGYNLNKDDIKFYMDLIVEEGNYYDKNKK